METRSTVHEKICLSEIFEGTLARSVGRCFDIEREADSTKGSKCKGITSCFYYTVTRNRILKWFGVRMFFVKCRRTFRNRKIVYFLSDFHTPLIENHFLGQTSLRNPSVAMNKIMKWNNFTSNSAVGEILSVKICKFKRF